MNLPLLELSLQCKCCGWCLQYKGRREWCHPDMSSPLIRISQCYWNDSSCWTLSCVLKYGGTKSSLPFPTVYTEWPMLKEPFILLGIYSQPGQWTTWPSLFKLVATAAIISQYFVWKKWVQCFLFLIKSHRMHTVSSGTGVRVCLSLARVQLKKDDPCAVK